MSEFDDIKIKINACLERLYTNDETLFSKNNGRGVCERCLVFRLAHYLQKEFLESEYMIDCDYNSSFARGKTQSGKPIVDRDGNVKKRFVDIIIHKRNSDADTDFLCFEIKKWNNYDKKGFEKDEDNLTYLTSAHGYRYGFHIILSKDLKDVKIIEYKRNSN